jgi:chromosome segregation ATPase
VNLIGILFFWKKIYSGITISGFKLYGETTLPDTKIEVTNTPVTLLDDNVLLSIIIEKHNRFIGEFSSELKELDEKMNSGRSEYNRVSKELEILETRLVVLKEKRHQLYFQAGKLRLRFLETISDKEKIQHLESDIRNIENKLQNANLSSSEEYGYIDRIMSLVKEIIDTVPYNDMAQQATVSSILDILETAKAARSELDEMLNAPDEHRKEAIALKQEVEDQEARLAWLNRRIGLHKEALGYWENVGAGEGATIIDVSGLSEGEGQQ